MPPMDGAAHPGAVVASPMQHVVDVHDRVAGVQLDRDAAGQGAPRVVGQRPVFDVGVEPPVAAGYNPEYIVVVEGDVPLQIFGAVLQQVLLQAGQRRHVDRVDVAMPRGRAMIAYRAAHQHHAGHRRRLRDA